MSLTHTITDAPTTTYTIDQLSKDARERAINNHRDWNVDHGEWAEAVKEQAFDLARYLGINMSQIWFSGFWSQGDGACFEGVFHLEELDLRDLREDQDVPVGPLRQPLQELENIALPLQHLFEVLTPFERKANDEGASITPYAKITSRGRYQHEHTMHFNFDYEGFEEAFRDAMDEVDFVLLQVSYREAVRAVTHGSNPDSDIDELVEDTMRDFARWIYRQLEQEYEHLTSDEQVYEALQANDMRFTEDGDDA